MVTGKDDRLPAMLCPSRLRPAASGKPLIQKPPVFPPPHQPGFKRAPGYPRLRRPRSFRSEISPTPSFCVCREAFRKFVDRRGREEERSRAGHPIRRSGTNRAERNCSLVPPPVVFLVVVVITREDDCEGSAAADSGEADDGNDEPRHAAFLSRAFRRAISRSAASRLRPETAPISGSTMMQMPSSVMMMERCEVMRPPEQ